MDQNTKDIAKSGAKVLENVTEFFNKLAGPMAEELGLMFGDKVRYYRVKNWISRRQQGFKCLLRAVHNS